LQRRCPELLGELYQTAQMEFSFRQGSFFRELVHCGIDKNDGFRVTGFLRQLGSNC
jgi:hypothetical protein